MKTIKRKQHILLVEDEALIASAEKLLTSMIDSAPFGAHLYDLNSDNELIFTGYNSAAEKILGVSHEQFIGKSIEEAFSALVETPIPEAYRSVAKTGAPYFTEQIDYDQKGISGAFEVYAVSRGQNKIAAFFRNITEQKRAEADLRKSEERFRSFFENANVGIYRTSAEGKIIMANPALIKMLGFDSFDELAERNLEKDGFETKFLRRKFMDEIESEGEILAQESVWKLKSGDKIDVMESARPIRDENGKTLYYEGIVEDISIRKQTEKALLRSEASFRQLFQESPLSTMLFDLDTGELIDVNKTALEVYACLSLEELKQFDFWCDPPYSLKDILEWNKKAGEEGPQHIEWLSRKKNGEYFWEEVFLRKLYMHGAERIIAVSVDITERKRMKEELKIKSEAMEASMEGMAILDVRGTYTYMNRAHAKIYGYNHTGELIGKSWQVLYGQDELKRFSDEIMPFFYKIGAWRGEAVGRKKDGHLFPQNVSLTALKDGGLICVVQDITPRKEIEEALKEREILLRTLIDNLPAAIYAKDTKGRKILINKADARNLGVDSEEDALGKTDFDFFPEEQAKSFYDDDQHVLKTGEPVLDREEKLRQPEGNDIWLLTSKLPLRDAENRISGLIGIGLDITERKSMEEAVRRQLKDKEILLKEVHHRIKNNITSIRSLLTLQARSVINQEAKAILYDTISRVESMRKIYDKLLVTDDYRELPVKDYMEDLTESVIDMFPEKDKVSLNFKIDHFSLPVKILFPLGTIVNELITNAMKYAFENRKTGNIGLSILKRNDKIVLTVKDDGAGLPESFDPGKSTGFGIMLVKLFSEQLNGTFTIQSDNGTKAVVQFSV